MNIVIVHGVEIKYIEEAVTIVDSYKVRRKYMRRILEDFLLITGYRSRRGVDSWVREWRAHNIMYKLRLFRSHTKDCDLEEDIKLKNRIIYWILGGI